MKIYTQAGKQAKLVQDSKDPKPVYKCFRQGRPDNTDSHAEKFDSIEDAAYFLIANPGAGIRMDPEHAIISEGIIIDGKIELRRIR